MLNEVKHLGKSKKVLVGDCFANARNDNIKKMSLRTPLRGVKQSATHHAHLT